MTLLGVALADLRFHRTRTLLTATGVGIAVAVLLSLWGLNTGYERALDDSIQHLGYHVIVTSKGCPYESATLFLRGGNIPMYIDEEIYQTVLRDEAVEAVTPLFLQAVSDPETGRHRLFVGIDQESFFPMKDLEFQRGGPFSGPLVREAIVGYTVAEYLDLKLGDTIGVPGRPLELRVVGVLDRSGSQDDGTTFIPLQLAQQVFDKKSKLTGIGVRLHHPEMVDAFVARVYDIPSVQPIMMGQVRRTVLELLNSARIFVTAVAVVAILVAALAVMNTTLMAVMERTGEMGVMRAIGASRANLFMLIGSETVLACLLGGLLGVVLAVAGASATEALAREHLPFAPVGSLIVITWGSMAKAVGVSMMLGALAALYPALHAAALHPVQAIRRLR